MVPKRIRIRSFQAQIDATIKYFKAHNAREIKIDACGILSENKSYTYVYIVYKLELENGQEYPCISTFMTGLENRKYYVLPPSKVTEDMSKQAATEYAKFMTTDTYKNILRIMKPLLKRIRGMRKKLPER